MEKIEGDAKMAKEAINRWTDNIFAGKLLPNFVIKVQNIHEIYITTLIITKYLLWEMTCLKMVQR